MQTAKSYLTDDYVKYFGLSLGDADKNVRLEAIRQILAM